MKFVIDAYGADAGESVIVRGCIDALNIRKDLEIILVGNADTLTPLLKKCAFDKSRIEIVDAKDTIENDESPTLAIKNKKQSSMVVGFDLCKQRDDVDGFISAGSTGALLTGAVLKIGRMPGVLRPALIPVFPTVSGRYVAICDSGANMDCLPEYLAQFALMGSCYMRAVSGIEQPKVALVSVGEESKKGNELTHAAYEKISKLPVNFVGNMESRDAMSGNYDVLVCDGFVGNVLLKSIEGTAMFVMNVIKSEIKTSKRAKFGALFMKKAFKNIKNKMDYQKIGGACFVGVKKIVVKAHGSSTGEAICAAIMTACQLQEKKLLNNITEMMAALKAEKID